MGPDHDICIEPSLLYYYDPLDDSYREIGAIVDSSIYVEDHKLIDPDKVTLPEMKKFMDEEFVVQFKMDIFDRLAFKWKIRKILGLSFIDILKLKVKAFWEGRRKKMR